MEEVTLVNDSELDYVQQDVDRDVRNEIARSDMGLRVKMTESMLSLFIKVNVAVLSVVVLVIIVDTWLIVTDRIKPDVRLINSEVIMTLIGAATVQLGAVVFTIAGYLFRKQS